MAHRIRPLQEPVELFHDGQSLPAERGEPLAVALIGADRLLLARSPKLHRPRGPYCLRGACDGCLARVNGIPNVMTCLVPAQGGEQIHTQNVLGTRGVDMLRASDFLFPHGIDQHRLFAGVSGLSSVVQAFARRMAGLGRLPGAAVRKRPATRCELRLLIVGAGAAGLSAAAELGRFRPRVVDDALVPGGSLRALDPVRANQLLLAARKAGADIHSRTTAIGLYREPEKERWLYALLAGPEHATLALCQAVLVASGAHDPVLAFGNNDLPGVWSARAALNLWQHGVVLGKRGVLVEQGRFSEAFEQVNHGTLEIRRLGAKQLLRAVGRSRLQSVMFREALHERKLRADALIVDGPGAPGVELLLQAGASVVFDASRAYRPKLEEHGRAALRVWCAGSAAASSHDSASHGARVAQDIAGFLAAEVSSR